MDNFNNILLINYGGIGDEILFLPVVSSLKKKFPNAKITLALEPRAKCIKSLCPLIDEIIPVEIKTSSLQKIFNILKLIILCYMKGFDCVIASGKSPLVALILFLTGIKKRIGYKTKTSFLLTDSVVLNENQYASKMYHDLLIPFGISDFNPPEISITEDFKLDDRLILGEYICVHPGVSKMSVRKNIFKCPKPEFFKSLIKGILKKNKQVVLLGSKDDREIVTEILNDNEITSNALFFNYFEKTKNILEMAFLMKNSKISVTVDSAPLHVSAAVGAKTFAIFGPTNENKLVPKCDNVTVFVNNVSCRPCLWHKRSVNCASSECLNIDHNMILDKIN